MNPVIVDVMLHIKGTLERTALEEIRQSLLNLDGVSKASYRNKRPHLMMVEYDPEIINSLRLLETVKIYGFSAALVGL